MNTLFKLLVILFVFYILICVFLFFFQEKIIFFPNKTPKAYKFDFPGNHQEINVKSSDGALLNGLLFKAENSNGLIFYLHGNGGTIESWGHIAETYTNLNYDIFILDYRSYGKSEGKISSQQQLFTDNQIVYNYIKTLYPENKIIILGYSLGSGMASKIAADNNPKKLILQAPYYSIIDMMKHSYRILPTFILKYKFETNKYLKSCNMPVYLIHGDIDEVIYYNSSVKLHNENKNKTKHFTLLNQGHDGITYNTEYQKIISEILQE